MLVAYIANAQSWLSGTPLNEIFRPPLLSWIIDLVWLITGESWLSIKYLSPTFAITAGFILYLTLKSHKGRLFAFGVTALTMLNLQVLFWSTQTMTESLSLLFIILVIYFFKRSPTKTNWLLAGILMGLTFASRYPIFAQAVVIFIVESLIHRNVKLSITTILGLLPIVILVISSVYLKADTFAGAVRGDIRFTPSLSTLYLTQSLNIWGIAFVLVPIAFIFRRTYYDKYNYVFIVWFLFSLLFWSSNSGASPYQGRFVIQYTPAVYYLVMLAVENIWKNNNLLYNIKKFLSSLKHILRKRYTKIIVTSDIEELKRLVALGWEYRTTYIATADSIAHHIVTRK